MKRVNIDQLKPGDVVAKHVHVEGNRVLCSPGTRLESEVITLLSRRGVTSVSIEDGADERKSSEELLHELDARFAKVTHDPLMRDLKELFRNRIVDGTITH